MKIAWVLLCSIYLSSCVSAKQVNTDKEKQLYKNWVLSRCVSYIANNQVTRQDALNTASAYLEVSSLPVESFVQAEPLIKKYIEANYQGSIPGGFELKKCIDLFSADELDSLYNGIKKKS